MSLRLDWCSYKAAKYAVNRWHYSRSMPLTPLVKVGVWESDAFIGCVLFSRGGCDKLGGPYGLVMTEVCELSRIALTRHEAPVTRIVSIALGMLRRLSPGLRLVVSYADPNNGHRGVIYQAGGWVYTGATDRDAKYRDAAGRIWHSRLVSSSGRKANFGRVDSVPRPSECERIPLLGKYRYVYPLDRKMRAQIEPLRQPPPRAGSIDGDAPADQAGEGGSTPTPAL